MKRAKAATEGSSLIKHERNHRNWKEGSMGCWPHRRILGRQRWGALRKVQRRGWAGEPTVTGE